MAWMRAICGRLKSDYRYSKDIVYNNFPWPLGGDVRHVAKGNNDNTDVRHVNSYSDSGQRSQIEQTAQRILDVRALYPDSSLADLYDTLTMPPELRRAHQDNDRAVMEAYGLPSNSTENEITAHLFSLYNGLCEPIATEKTKR
ncbi:MAG: methylase [Bacteroidales bacterium]|nr:methylase [Bacteroidales bacterium]